jgi:hypothetical protein
MLSGCACAHQVVMMLPLSDAVECGAVLQGLAASAESPLGHTMMSVKHKLRASFLTPDRRDVRACLDACKVPPPPMHHAPCIMLS